MNLCFTVNGRPVELDVPADQRLIDILHQNLGLTGVKEGCGEGECGACTVLLEGKAILSCLTLACQVQGKSVITIEGLAEDDQGAQLQQAFVDETAIQCGYCTPGMVLAARHLLATNPHPTEEEIRLALSGNLCRCSGYVQIVRAVQKAAQQLGGQ